MRTVKPEIAEKINTIYIISKGRPQCKTARTLEKMEYPGKWYIVCGNNDDTVQEYIDRWGQDKIIVFDWYEQIKHTDTMDNMGFEETASGAAPVRNAVREISEEHGEWRHWQFDDDYTHFSYYNSEKGKNVTFRKGDGQKFYDWLARIAYFAHRSKLKNCGFAVQSMGVAPANRFKVSKRVFNAHNMPSDRELFQTWRGRLNDDVVNALDIMRKGGREFSFAFLQMNMVMTQQEAGGLTQLYQDTGTVRKTAYAVMAMPQCVKLTIKYGRYHHKANWNGMSVKILDEKWKKVNNGERQAEEGN